MIARGVAQIGRAKASSSMHMWLGRMPAAVLFVSCGMAVAAPPAATVVRSLAGQLETADISAISSANRRASSKDLRSPQVRAQRERAVASIRSFGGRFDGDEELATRGATTAQRDGRSPRPASPSSSAASIPEPPPALDYEPVVPSNGSAATVDGLVADAYVSPEFADRPSALEPAVSLTIDKTWRGGDDGLRALANVGRISTLHLTCAPLTDASLESLARLSQLETLRIEGGSFSQQALERLHQRQPQLRIVVSH